jgi:hypothetical protein
MLRMINSICNYAQFAFHFELHYWVITVVDIVYVRTNERKPCSAFGHKKQQTYFLFLFLLSQYKRNGQGKIKEK